MSLCPSSDRLQAYEQGELSDAEAGGVERHLATCSACRAGMECLRSADREARLLRAVIYDSQATTGSVVTRPIPTVATGSNRPTLEGKTLEAPAARGGDSPGDWLIADYERVQLCGEGAYGSVWAVRDRVGVFRALKIIDMEKMTRAKLSCRESTALETYCRRVGRHPYLIDVYHVGIVGGQLYYTMELADNDATKSPVDGEFPKPYRPLTLQTVIRRRRISPDTAIEIVRRLLRGLAKLHHLELVHRDIKPANIIFVKRRPKLADIGMVALGEQIHPAAGTPRYMPPDRVMDRSADTYAMGKVLHEMMAGLDAPSFPRLPPECLRGGSKWDLHKVEEVIGRACSAEAADRYAHASELLDDIEACAEFPFPTLFEDTEDSASTGMAPRMKVRDRILLEFLRKIPWIVGLAALFILSSWLKRTP